MSYQTFVTDGTVKGLRIVAVGDPDNSVMIHALLGDTPEFSDGGDYGRMPLGAAEYFSPAEIDEIKDWISRKCPEEATRIA